ncbi:sensor histidine kinase [Flavobacterium cerinum]|uniref:histidine kinase n=1 Tax=Flavobacterium cerinum TaxID=2502784 RepID=A0ABY5IVF4_9FLAO|nr:HAMP domain-containing sensor histidine kinase [Flavobacterium cerinum]UUC46809.1 HAMP domain-containing histidine kinase [Flavobacterium cerinum]
MKSFFRNHIVYWITFTILITVGIQIYWNITSYRTNKQNLINTIQIALDNGIDSYYSEKAKSNITYRDTINLPDPSDLPVPGDVKNIRVYRTKVQADSSKPKHKKVLIKYSSDEPNPSVSEIKNIQVLAQKIIIAVRQDSIDLPKIANYLDREFSRKQLDMDYALLYTRNHRTVSEYQNPGDKKYSFTTASKSTYLPQDGKLELFFPDIFFKTLKEGLAGILLSLILSLCIVFSLFYLLYIIRQQKQLAIIKNDFISNVSHELKTPIAVVTSALEGIEKFNTENEPEKTKKYLAISNQHLAKLHQIVEKILETSFLESDQLQLRRESVNLNELTQNILEKIQIKTEKSISLKTTNPEILIYVDVFHFENVITNLIDNAIKYGGDQIILTLTEESGKTSITVSDNGSGIDKSQRAKIFDKFYRIPSNNRHDQKGFGIGLYYARNIILKHGGTLELISDEITTFKITIPHE